MQRQFRNHSIGLALLVTLGIAGEWRVLGATVFVGVHFGPSPDNVIIASGDAVVWQNTNAMNTEVWSYSGAWSPAILATNGASFTNVFSTPGYYPYRIT